MGWSDKPWAGRRLVPSSPIYQSPEYGPPVTTLPIGTGDGPKNRYPGVCCDCGTRVAPWAGRLVDREGRRVPRCQNCVDARKERA